MAKMFRKDVGEALQELPPKKKEYVKGVFEKELKKGSGISKWHIERELNRMRHDSGRPLGSSEIKQLKEKMGEHFEEK